MKQYDKIKRFLEHPQTQLHVGKDTICTPFELIEEILDKLPEEIWSNPNIRLLDPACGRGSFLVAAKARFIDAGLDEKHVVENMLYGVDLDPRDVAVATFAINPEKKYNVNIVIDDSLTREWNMKFDVIVGNPPYQEREENGNHPLWPKFVEIATRSLKQGGYLAFITPRSWIGKQSNRSNNYDVFIKKQILHLEVFDQKSSPFDVGSTICWYIIQNVDTQHPTSVFQHIDNQQVGPLVIQLGGHSFLPGILNEQTLSINDKISKGNRMQFVKSYEFHNEKLKKKGLVSDIRNTEFKYTNYVSHRIVRYTNIKFSNHNTWKVMIPSTSTIDKCIIANECGHGEDMYSIYVSSEEEANRVAEILKSNLFRYIGKMYRGGRNMISAFRLQVFPFIDTSRSWTDKELYQHFNLTEEEIKFIEEFVK